VLGTENCRDCAASTKVSQEEGSQSSRMRAEDIRTGGRFLARERGAFERHADQIHAIEQLPVFPLGERLTAASLAVLARIAERLGFELRAA
jgi:hypothetical protein